MLFVNNTKLFSESFKLHYLNAFFYPFLFKYYTHREKMRLIGREDDLENVNRKALKIARQVADATGTMMAGNVCNSTIYSPDDKESHEKCRKMFEVHCVIHETRYAYFNILISYLNKIYMVYKKCENA